VACTCPPATHAEDRLLPNATQARRCARGLPSKRLPEPIPRRTPHHLLVGRTRVCATRPERRHGWIQAPSSRSARRGDDSGRLFSCLPPDQRFERTSRLGRSKPSPPPPTALKPASPQPDPRL